MSTALTKIENLTLAAREHELEGFVSMRVDKQLIGISVLMVRDVLRKVNVTNVPLSQPEVAGSMNLRGRIVTVIDMRQRLGLPPREEGQKTMHAVVEHQDELFSLMVDGVGDVLNLPINKVEKAPANLDHQWSGVAAGVCRLEDELLVILDVQALLTF